MITMTLSYIHAYMTMSSCCGSGVSVDCGWAVRHAVCVRLLSHDDGQWAAAHTNSNSYYTTSLSEY